MALLTLANITHAHGDKRVLDGVSLSLERGDKVGLVGRNGCGKTTLLRIIAGHYPPDDGQVQTSRGTRIGYLQQDPQLDLNRTLRREAEQAFGALARLHDALDALSHEMAAVTDGDELDRLMKRYERVEHDMQAAGGYTVDHKIDAVLHGLGITDELFDVPVRGLSGGQKARLALSKLLLSEPEIILLDEPTNHLDIAGRQWLEGFLKDYPGAVLVVSHDRWLLDEVVGKIVEVERGRLFEYPGNYHAYREQRELRRLEQQRVYDKQQSHIRQQKQYIDRYKTGQRAKEARGRQKKLERYIRDEVVEQVHHDKVMHFQLPAARRSGDMVLSAEKLSKRYDSHVLFADVDLKLMRGEKIGIIGPNGCGKTTLVNTLLGRIEPDAGRVRSGSQLDIGVFDQTHEHLDLSDTPVSYLQRQLDDHAEQSARDVAGAFLFSGIDQEKPLGVLSGGERARCVLAGLVVSGHNLLILDEPSNHLDIPSAERLEHALLQYDGTMILITHDRMLLEDTVEELLIFDGAGGVKRFLGKYSDYLAYQRRRQAEAQAAREVQVQAQVAAARQQRQAEHKQSAESKPNKVKRRYGSFSDEQLEQKIMDLEAALADMDRQLADPALYQDYKQFNALQDARADLVGRLKPLEAEWERRAEQA